MPLGYKHTEESKRKMSLACKGKNKGKIPWNKGKKGILSEESRRKMRLSRIGKKPNLGHKHTEEAKRKMSLARKGKISLNSLARQGRIFSKETRRKMSLAQMGNKNSLGCKPTKETIRKRLIRKTPSSLEKKMIDIIKKLNLPYKFVGNGEFFIERKCPDFINVNGEKIAIEVFYRKHKEEFRKGLENWKKERSKIFAKYGWKLIFLNEVQVNEDYIKDVIGINPK